MKMSGMTSKAFGVVLTLLISACAYPNSMSVQGGKETALYFDHVPADARVFIDGQEVGRAEQFDGEQAVLAVTSGRHMVKIRLGSSVIYEKDLYLGDGVVLKIDVNRMEVK